MLFTFSTGRIAEWERESSEDANDAVTILNRFWLTLYATTLAAAFATLLLLPYRQLFAQCSRSDNDTVARLQLIVTAHVAELGDLTIANRQHDAALT